MNECGCFSASCYIFWLQSSLWPSCRHADRPNRNKPERGFCKLRLRAQDVEIQGQQKLRLKTRRGRSLSALQLRSRRRSDRPPTSEREIQQGIIAGNKAFARAGVFVTAQTDGHARSAASCLPRSHRLVCRTCACKIAAR